jgi:hypothetical protein
MIISKGDVFEFMGNMEDDPQLGLYAQVGNSQFNIIDIETGNRWGEAKKIINGLSVEHVKLENLWDITISLNSIMSSAAHKSLLTKYFISLEQHMKPYPPQSKALETFEPKRNPIDYTTTLQTILKKILNSKGKIFTVKFEKADGSMRTMNCRIGVGKYVKGTGKPHNNPETITVYDLQAKDYRSFNINRVQWAKIAGVMYYNENWR